MDHCFLGSELDEADRKQRPFLILHDSKSESLYCIPVQSKAISEWIVICFKTLIEEMGYGGIIIGFKSDNAEELIYLKRKVSEMRSAETVPITVPVRVSQSNGAIERAVKTWQGHFRTLRSHLEVEVGVAICPDHPIWEWCALWANCILRRYAVRSSGRTSYEMVTGHRANVPIACFGMTILRRRKRKEAGSGKWDCEYTDGIFLGLGTPALRSW